MPYLYCNRKAVHPFLPRYPRDSRRARLKPSAPAAPRRSFLPLLSSDPDGVQKPPVARVLALNTRPAASTVEQQGLVREFNPAVADCGLQGTANSPSSTAFIHMFPVLPEHSAFQRVLPANIRYNTVPRAGSSPFSIPGNSSMQISPLCGVSHDIHLGSL